MNRLNTGFSLSLILVLSLVGLRCQTTSLSSETISLENGFDAGTAMDMVNYLSDRWRVRGGGNPGYNESIDYIAQYLRDEGFEDTGSIEIMEVPLTLHPLAWDPVDATLSMVSPQQQTLHTYSDTPTILGRLSGSTPEGGVTARLIDVGTGDDPADYEGLDLSGAIVLGSGRATTLYEEAVVQRGAVGVLSDRLRLDEFHELYPDMVLTVRLPFTTPEEMLARDTWALKISTRTATQLRAAVKAGPVELHAEVKTRFFEATQRNLIVEIPGATHPQQRVVFYAHVDNNKPGANNNTTGNTAHAQLARILAQMIQSGEIERPARTISFLFGSEHEFARQWLERHAGSENNILAMVNADMTGANTDLTHGIYRLERGPDPTMDIPRAEAYRAPQDQRSGWGFRPLPIVPYPGHYLSDFAESLVEDQVSDDWPVHASPFEGGSDHDEFLNARVPSVLSWYWEDHFISTNLDTPDKVSVESMQQVQRLHGRIALGIAAATEESALSVLELVRERAVQRLALELETSNAFMADAAPGDADRARRSETERLDRWGLWYDEAMESVTLLPVEGATENLLQQVARARVQGQEDLARAKEALHGGTSDKIAGR